MLWLYHSHVDEMRDIASGLFGAIIVTGRGKALEDGRPADVDREFVEKLLAEVWDKFEGGDQGGMAAYKLLGRTEKMDWNPPVLT